MDKITVFGSICQDPEKPRSGDRPSGALVPPGSPGETAGFLPCLYSNNSILDEPENERIEVISSLLEFLTPYHKKMAETLFLNVSRIINLAPSIGHVGFLTLTFPDNVTDHTEALRRFNSMNSNFLMQCPDFLEWICVKEVQNRGAWHYHLLVTMAQDIREGFNFQEYSEFMNQITPDIKKADRARLSRSATASANDYLRSTWAMLRHRLPAYGFGRSELLPIKSTTEGMARYMGKYVGKLFSCGKRPEQMRGVRLVSYSRGWEKNSPKFQWHTEGSQEWRRKLRLFATMNACEDFYDLTKKLGPTWAYDYAPTIFEIDDLLTRANADVPF